MSQLILSIIKRLYQYYKDNVIYLEYKIGKETKVETHLNDAFNIRPDVGHI